MTTKKKKTITIRNPSLGTPDGPCELAVEYVGSFPSFDRFLRSIAKSCRGKEIGSGYDLEERIRDLQYRFPSSRDRDEFKECVRTIASAFVVQR